MHRKYRNFCLVLCACVFSLNLIAPLDASCVPYQYNVTGTLTDYQGLDKPLWGTMLVQDELVQLYGDESSAYGYSICEFSIYSESLTLVGPAGSQGGAISFLRTSRYIGDRMWALNPFIEGVQNYWIGEEWTFFRDDLTPYAEYYEEYHELARKIRFYFLSYDTGFPWVQQLEIFAERIPTPVPEPSGALLVSFSLVSIIVAKRKWMKGRLLSDQKIMCRG